MKNQFSEVNGLQDPIILGEKFHFNVYRSIPFAHVLHDSRLNWVAISSYGCAQEEIYLIDSLFNGKVAEHTKRQICSILNCSKDTLNINTLPVP